MTDNVDKLNELLKRDPDTGLYSRHILLQNLSRRIRENPKSPFAYGIIRMDEHYQRIRHYRDRQKILLYITAQRIKEIVGEEFLFQSDRSDEFLVIIPGVNSEEELDPFFQNLMDKISEPYNQPASDLSFGCHMGMALYPTHAETVEELMDNSEIALGIFEQRHDQGYIYSQALGEAHNRRRTLETIMTKAVGNNLQGFHIVYQPLVNEDKEVLSCEALMRWDAPGFGSVSPDSFIPIAEETGLINTLGHWILYSSILQVKKWREETGFNITVSVNVSSIQLEYSHYIENVRSVLESLDMDGECLHLEVTESTLMDEPEEIVKKLDELRDMGIKIMLDDFGTGYSSLSYLHQLPIDTLKIAKEFVDDILTNQKNLDVVKAIQSISKSFGLITLAEGVEHQDQFDLLIKEGCNMIQGYIVSPPVAAMEFSERFLKK
ncbi:MAG: EAL domain-containing protein [Spirochaetales bacterium]|nr:EAL domain-containing protein [Spirochaetales bacterium]